MKVKSNKMFFIFDLLINSEMELIGDRSLQNELEVLMTAKTVISTDSSDPQQDTSSNKKRQLDDNNNNQTTPSKKLAVDLTIDQASADCCVCWENKKNVLFLPCKHCCICSKCAAKTTCCPLCRSPIASTTTIFL